MGAIKARNDPKFKFVPHQNAVPKSGSFPVGLASDRFRTPMPNTFVAMPARSAVCATLPKELSFPAQTAAPPLRAVFAAYARRSRLNLAAASLPKLALTKAVSRI
jgi:hypothetical protein